jgi:hypothetical protein
MDSRARSGSRAGRSSQMSTNITWHGTQEESFALISAIARNCTCQFGLMGARLNVCSPHQMLTDDQRALNGLLFARHNLSRLLLEEFEVNQEPAGER